MVANKLLFHIIENFRGKKSPFFDLNLGEGGGRKISKNEFLYEFGRLLTGSAATSDRSRYPVSRLFAIKAIFFAVCFPPCDLTHRSPSQNSTFWYNPKLFRKMSPRKCFRIFFALAVFFGKFCTKNRI